LLTLARTSIKRPVFATMMTLAMVVVGIVGYVKLGVDRFPSVDLPSVRVQTRLPGASPEEIETEVSELIEEAVNTVEGIEQLRSISGPGSSVVIATFSLDRDVDAAAQDVRDRVSTVLRNLPEGAEPPVVAKVDADSDPAITIAVSGPRSLRELREIAHSTVRPLLERSKGVGEVRLVGGEQRTMNVWLDADRLDAHDLPVSVVREAISSQNANVPGGNVTGGAREASLRTLGRLSDANAFGGLVVATRGGTQILLSDVATVEDGVAERRNSARLDGVPTVVLEVVRQSGSSTVEVIDRAKASLALVQATLPADIRLEVIRDQSRYIHAALHEINLHLVLGSLLASLVVLVFMRSWRSTFIACVAIPASVIATFAVMWWLGFTLNSVTMLALVLMVGIVIDDAIVVLENIFRFVEEKGLSPMEAARKGTAEIGLAVLATTLSLVVIFVPVSFMSSIAGRFLFQFGITSAVAILVSLFISFTLTPMMASRILKPRPGEVATVGGAHAQAASRRGFYGLIERIYMALLRTALRHRWLVALLSVGVIWSSVPLLATTKQEFVPSDVDEAEFQVSVSAPEGVSMAAMEEAMVRVESEIRQVRGVRTTLATAGGGFLGQVNSGNVYVRIAPHDERVLSISRLLRALWSLDPGSAWRGNYSQADVMTEVNARLRLLAPLRCQVRNFPSFNIGGGSWDVDFVLLGPRLDELFRYSEAIRGQAMETGDFRGLDTTLRLNKPEVRVAIDRQRAGDLGVRAQDVGGALRLLVGGDDEVSRFRDEREGEDYDVRLRLEPQDRDRPELLELLRIPRAGGTPIALASVASYASGQAPSRIDRLDRRRTVSIRGGMAPGVALADGVARLRTIAAGQDMPPAYTTRLLGRSLEMERTANEFVWAFILSFVFMYMILASQFESLVHPVTILVSLPLSIPFALLSLQLAGGALNLFSALGVLVLFGVVKKNSILQVDHTNGLRAKGLSREEAILTANRDRLRPILMTTFALVAGMLPLALGTGPGAEERRSVGIVVIGGQSLCLLLTLLATPVVYSLLDDLGAWIRRRGGRQVR
jgi:HAE1 family hydrophobic/amphiphilic exporter-1